MSTVEPYVDFDLDQWMSDRGLLETRKVRISGRVYEVNVSVPAAESLKALNALDKNNYASFFAVYLTDPKKVEELVSRMKVPLRAGDFNAMWQALIAAVSGRLPGESKAS